jgi:hypothetical protein
VNEVLDLARIEAGRLTVHIAPAPVGVAADAAIALTQPLADMRGVHLETGCRGNRALAYEGDEHRTRQILVNLLSNAVKFTRPGGHISLECGSSDSPPATLRSARRRSWIYLKVTDTGVGIPGPQLTSIFDPFVQVETGHTRTSEGSGLGLTISRRLARLMRGDLSVASTIGQGSEFTLWLPAANGTDEWIETRSAGPGAPIAAEGLGDVGRTLLGAIRPIVDSYVVRLRGVQHPGGGEALTYSQLADHIATYVADIACMLIALEETGGRPSALVTGASELHRLIAERHGTQRAAMGWSVDELQREYALLEELLDTALRRSHTALQPAAVEAALALIARFLDHARDLGIRALVRGG